MEPFGWLDPRLSHHILGPVGVAVDMDPGPQDHPGLAHAQRLGERESGPGRVQSRQLLGDSEIEAQASLEMGVRLRRGGAEAGSENMVGTDQVALHYLHMGLQSSRAEGNSMCVLYPENGRCG